MLQQKRKQIHNFNAILTLLFAQTHLQQHKLSTDTDVSIPTHFHRFYIQVAPCDVWDLSSLTRDLTALPVLKAGSVNHWTTRKITQINFLQLTQQIMIFFTLTREYTNSEFLEEHKEAILNKKKRKEGEYGWS